MTPAIPRDYSRFHVGPAHVMIEISGQERKIEAFIEAMRPYGIMELVRTGRIALLRSGDSAEEPAETAPAPTTPAEPPPGAMV